jgi:hypothetical protein
MFLFVLGDYLQDEVTGFKGVVVGRGEFYAESDQYLLQPKCKDDNVMPNRLWIQSDRLKSARSGDNTSEHTSPVELVL